MSVIIPVIHGHVWDKFTMGVDKIYATHFTVVTGIAPICMLYISVKPSHL